MERGSPKGHTTVHTYLRRPGHVILSLVSSLGQQQHPPTVATHQPPTLTAKQPTHDQGTFGVSPGWLRICHRRANHGKRFQLRPPLPWRRLNLISHPADQPAAFLRGKTPLSQQDALPAPPTPPSSGNRGPSSTPQAPPVGKPPPKPQPTGPTNRPILTWPAGNNGRREALQNPRCRDDERNRGGRESVFVALPAEDQLAGFGWLVSDSSGIKMVRWWRGPPRPWHRIRMAWQAASWVGRWRGWPGTANSEQTAKKEREREREGESQEPRETKRACKAVRACANKTGREEAESGVLTLSAHADRLARWRKGRMWVCCSFGTVSCHGFPFLLLSAFGSLPQSYTLSPSCLLPRTPVDQFFAFSFSLHCYTLLVTHLHTSQNPTSLSAHGPLP
ncbi:hypothetical protein B0J13DRAFT_44436 [Dactylonectria estremocensis]|uniref:Uncharacterized protein n=1 Tax=Dactylonectria estremocensis TaxID=1079267 RepID=A0A9P9EQF0_9HYPO|nr:hypothetical protein B0J13DRAFT_44436 [Dactylonectria estremocensis]